MVKDRLPPNFSFGVSLNVSADDDHKDDERVYPDDDGRVIFDLEHKDVVDLLCREERVPQWIDISVSSVNRRTTFIHLLCCGRFHSEDERLYYFERGTQPFGIKSPNFPKGSFLKKLDGKKVGRFSLPSNKSFQANEVRRSTKH